VFIKKSFSSSFQILVSEAPIHNIVINIILIQNFLRGDGDVLLILFKNKTAPYLRLTGFAGTTPEGCSEGWMYFSQLCYILLTDTLPIYAYGVFFIFIYTHLPVTMCLLRKAFPHHSKYWSVKRLVNYKCPWRLLHQLCVDYIDNTTG
jgi:hypothetical protein